MLLRFKSFFKSDITRVREQALLNISNGITNFGIEFVRDIQSIPWMIKAFLRLVDDTIGTVRDASINVLESMYKHDSSIKSVIENSNLRRDIIAKIIETFELSNTKNDTDETNSLISLSLDSFLLKIKPVTFSSEDKLLKEIKSIGEILGSNEKNSWESKVESMVKLQSILLGLDANSIDISILKNFEVQIKDIIDVESRAAIIKESTQLIILLSLLFKDKLSSFANRILPTLLKHHGATNKINSSSVDQCILALIGNSLPKNLIKHLNDCSTEKSNNLRSKCSYYLLTVLQTSPLSYLRDNIDLIETCIMKYIIDADLNVRKNTRMSFILFRSIWQSRGLKLYNEFDSSTQASIVKEERTFKSTRNLSEIESLSNGPLTPKKLKKGKGLESRSKSSLNEFTPLTRSKIAIKNTPSTTNRKLPKAISSPQLTMKRSKTPSKASLIDFKLNQFKENYMVSTTSRIVKQKKRIEDPKKNEITNISSLENDIEIQQNMFDGKIDILPDFNLITPTVKSSKARVAKEIDFEGILKPITKIQDVKNDTPIFSIFNERNTQVTENSNPNLLSQTPTTQPIKFTLFEQEDPNVKKIKDLIPRLSSIDDKNSEALDELSDLVKRVKSKDLEAIMDESLFSILQGNISSDVLTIRRKTTTCLVNIWIILGNEKFSRYLDLFDTRRREVLIHYYTSSNKRSNSKRIKL